MIADLQVTSVSKHFGEFKAVDQVSFDVEQGSFFSILGPSGCGKTTLLRMIAGFEEPSRGSIAIRGEDMAGVSPNRRPVNLVFQHLALFPMMNVADNIGFGLARKKVARAEIAQRVETMLERVGLPGYGKKRIDQLSGGQKQRIAIARCLVLNPTVLLLDEPLGALDLKLREQMKVELKKLQKKVGTTFIYITHDQSEALVMSDRIAVMNQGRFEQVDTPRNLYAKPATEFVARFVGDNNCWPGRCTHSKGELTDIATDSGAFFRMIAQSPGSDSKGSYYVRPESILIEPDVSRSDLNRLQVEVNSVLFDGANSRLLVSPAASEQEIIVSLPQNHQFDHIRPGMSIEIGWDLRAGTWFGTP